MKKKWFIIFIIVADILVALSWWNKEYLLTQAIKEHVETVKP